MMIVPDGTQTYAETVSGETCSGIHPVWWLKNLYHIEEVCFILDTQPRLQMSRLS